MLCPPPLGNPGIRITCPCIVYPLTPHFYIVKLGFAGYTFVSYFRYKTDCGYSLEPRVPAINVLSKNKKNITTFHQKIFIFTAVKYYSILYGRVFVKHLQKHFAGSPLQTIKILFKRLILLVIMATYRLNV